MENFTKSSLKLLMDIEIEKCATVESKGASVKNWDTMKVCKQWVGIFVLRVNTHPEA